MFGFLIVKICFILILKEKNDKVLTFNIVHFPNFEIYSSLKQAPHLTVSKFNKSRGRLLEEIQYTDCEKHIHG